jgi:hypothetical protein
LGISLSGKGWYCLRQPRHRGKSRVKLIQAILKCTYERARELAGYTATPLPRSEDNIVDMVCANLGATPKKANGVAPLHWPDEFKPLSFDRPLAGPYIGYLKRRGYTNKQIGWLIDHYGLAYATRGRFKSRLIVPVQDYAGRKVAWTGRAITPHREPRYLATEAHPPGEWLLGLPMLQQVPNPRALLIGEGPMDAQRISVLGHARGVYGTCLFGKRASSKQIRLLRELAPRFDYVGWILDADAELAVVTLQQVSGIRGPRLELPEGVGDPGELTRKSAEELFARIGT